MTDTAAADPTATEHLNLRDLPPVKDPVDPPERWSQTILSKADRCLRSAYLYQRHHGGMPAHALDRGSAFHLFVAKATQLLVEQGEPILPADLVKPLLAEVFAEHPELTMPLTEKDALRYMAHHWATNPHPLIDPAQVVAIEKKFLLPLGPYTVSGIIDVAMLDGQTGIVRDYKTQWDVPSWTEYAETFQGRLYALLLVYGHPVASDGSLEPPIGAHLDYVSVGEVFPRFSFENEGVPVRSLTLDRLQIEDVRHDIEQLCQKLAGSFESGKFPAVSGSHCSRCPCEPECPLPARLRRHAGSINDEHQAAEAAEWWFRWSDRIGATRTELRRYAKANGSIRFGADKVFEFQAHEGFQTDWEGLEAGLERAVRYGEPFDLATYRKPRNTTAFKTRTLTASELEAERQDRST